MTDQSEKTFRVFVTRHYIAVHFFDITTTTPRRARGLARKAAYKLTPDARATATDNGWIPDMPNIIELPHGPGSYPDGSKVALDEILPGVFKFRDHNAKTAPQLRAKRGPDVDGKPGWRGQYRTAGGGRWQNAASDYGPISYTTEEYALAGAKVCAERDPGND